jgi:aspartyl-tRNA(Asn)/glutamyl-tRNA(Gln) amidotransferase subunit C
MSNPIEPDQVRQVAKLARISINDEQLTGSSRQLNQILQYVEQLQQVDLPDDVQPFFGAVESVNAIREDQCVPSTDRDKILKNAPDSDGQFYQVPPVFK